MLIYVDYSTDVMTTEQDGILITNRLLFDDESVLINPQVLTLILSLSSLACAFLSLSDRGIAGPGSGTMCWSMISGVKGRPSGSLK